MVFLDTVGVGLVRRLTPNTHPNIASPLLAAKFRFVVESQLPSCRRDFGECIGPKATVERERQLSGKPTFGPNGPWPKLRKLVPGALRTSCDFLYCRIPFGLWLGLIGRQSFGDAERHFNSARAIAHVGFNIAIHAEPDSLAG